MRVTKPRIPAAIRAEFEQREAESAKLQVPPPERESPKPPRARRARALVSGTEPSPTPPPLLSPQVAEQNRLVVAARAETDAAKLAIEARRDADVALIHSQREVLAAR